MRIMGDVAKIFGVYDKQKNVNKTEKSATVASKKDVVSISNTAKDFQTVMKAIRDVPDVRQDKVDNLKEKFETGTYNKSGKDIADKILSSVVDSQA